MRLLILDHDTSELIINERRSRGIDQHDEVWDDVYIIFSACDDEHQKILTNLATLLTLAIGFDGPGAVRAGINVSDREPDWTRNYRVPDVAVILPGSRAVNRGTYWLGGPDFVVEVASPDDETRRKLAFYEAIGVRELLLVDRDPWALELYRLIEGRLELAGRSTPEGSETLTPEVVPLRFRLLPGGEGRPRIEVAHDGQRWTI